MVSFEILCCIAAAILALYYYLTSTFNFWESRGIRGPRPIPVFGNIKDVIFLKRSLPDYVIEVYNNYKNEPMIGIFTGREPVLILKDLDLIKDVLIKDFSEFPNRGIINVHKSDTFSQRISNLEVKRWKPLRARMTPVFTSNKLKEMFVLISNCADHFERYIEEFTRKNEMVECRELTAKYTTDVIGTCAFGIEMNALSDENSEFRRIGRKMFNSNWKKMLRDNIRQFTPRLYSFLNVILPRSEITKFFVRLTKETMVYRDKNNIFRNDFIDVLRDLKKNPDKLDGIVLDDSFLAAQAFIFFAAGFETSSSTMSHAMYELALNPSMQDKLREEIDQEYENGSTLLYENVAKLTYLDKIYKETLRKYPPVIFLGRRSISNYVFNGTNVSIPKNQLILIPVYSLHRDPRIYPKPDVFDPERCSEETKQSIYLAFGDGPRNCIGMRFANYQTKIGLIKLLRNYKIETCEETQIPYVRSTTTFLAQPTKGIYLKISKINRS